MNEPTPLEFDPALLARPAAQCEFDVTAATIAAYAAAINEEPDRSTDTAPALFAVVPPSDALDSELAALLPRQAWSSSVHGEHDLYITANIRAGMHVRTSVELFGVHPRRTGTQVVLRSHSEANGSSLNDQYWTFFVRNHIAREGFGEHPPATLTTDLKRPEREGSATAGIHEDQSYRYASASGDNTAYHIDDAAARAAGFPGVILHGLCTLAVAIGSLRHAIGFEDDRIGRIAGRFVRPVRPDTTIETSFWRVSALKQTPAFAFEVADDQANIAISNGGVELS